jgi:hypothetical protein
MASLLATVFPDAQYVCLHRHGLDQVYSVLQMDGATRVESRLPRYGGNTVAAAIERWCNQTERLLAFEHANGTQSLRIIYERFVENPENETLRLLTFLGLEPHPGLTLSAFQTSHDAGPGDPKIFKSRGVDRQRVGRGQTLDTSGLPRQLNRRLTRLLTILGYEVSGLDAATRGSRSPWPTMWSGQRDLEG